MDDREFWLAMRGGLLGIAAVEENESKRRSLRNMAALIALRYGSVVPDERAPVSINDAVSKRTRDHPTVTRVSS